MPGKERHKGREIGNPKVSSERVPDGEYVQSVFPKAQLEALKLMTDTHSIQKAFSSAVYGYLQMNEEEIKELEKKSGNKKDIFSAPPKSKKFVHAQLYLPVEDIFALTQKTHKNKKDALIEAVDLYMESMSEKAKSPGINKPRNGREIFPKKT